ncbi:MAG TPA: OsmC family protein [Gemmatimonadaceae bacterium]|nr:OsmC family protein [Gemmatimonadaceae bacterium]
MTTPKTGAFAVPAPGPRPPNRVLVEWRGGERFDAHRPGGPSIRIDGTGETGPGPVDSLLSALAACASGDVAQILAKRRTPAESMEIEVIGTRVDTIPRRLKHVLLKFRITGAGIDRDQAERAVELAVTKYCSVKDSLDPNVPIEWEIELGEAGSGKREATTRHT